MNNIDSTPEISIIVPVYNGKKYIRDCLESLVSQDYASDLYEIIIVDNGSSDDTLDIIKEFDVTLLHEHKKSSYAARNKGLATARGKFIAFTDSDCKADKSWLSSYMKCMKESGADLIGGDVRFYFTNPNSPAELLDSMINMQNEIDIPSRKIAKTANLFVKKTLFDSIGLFDSDLASGGDVEFTRRATNKNKSLIFCKDPFVSHPTRLFSELLKKSKRVGKGHADLSSKTFSAKLLVVEFLKLIKLWIRPPKVKFWKKRAQIKNYDLSIVMIIQIDFVHKFIESISKLNYLKQLRRKKHETL